MARTFEEIISAKRKLKLNHFCDDTDKMRDLNSLSMSEFLKLYPSITEEEYALTLYEWQNRNLKMYLEDRFFLRCGMVCWIYHNPDANSGNQFVINVFDRDLLELACKDIQRTGYDDVWDYIGGECRQYCLDYFDEDYTFWKELFESEPFAIGRTPENLYLLLNTI